MKVPQTVPTDIVYLIAEHLDEKIPLSDLINLALVSRSFHTVFTQQRIWDRVAVVRIGHIIRSFACPPGSHVREFLLPPRCGLFFEITSEVWKYPHLLYRVLDAVPNLTVYPTREDIYLHRNDPELLAKLIVKATCHTVELFLDLLPLELWSSNEFMVALCWRYRIKRLANYVPLRLRRNHEFALNLVLYDRENIYFLPAELLNDKEFMQKLTHADPWFTHHFLNIRIK